MPVLLSVCQIVCDFLSHVKIPLINVKGDFFIVNFCFCVIFIYIYLFLTLFLLKILTFLYNQFVPAIRNYIFIVTSLTFNLFYLRLYDNHLMCNGYMKYVSFSFSLYFVSLLYWCITWSSLASIIPYQIHIYFLRATRGGFLCIFTVAFDSFCYIGIG